MGRIDIIRHNRFAWDKQVEECSSDWTKPVSHAEINEARNGIFHLYLTPKKTVPSPWFPKIMGCKTLCLASGGGQQGPLLAAAGAEVTVYDNSLKQLQTDQMVADDEGLTITTVQGDMQDLSAFSDETFELIVHPVSNVFVPDIKQVWKEAARVLKPGGIMLAGFTNPVVYLFDSVALAENRLIVSHMIPYSPFNEDARAETELYIKHGEALEFGHTLQDQLAGQLDVGFVISGLYEDNNRDYAKSILDDYIPLYMATRSIKTRIP